MSLAELLGQMNPDHGESSMTEKQKVKALRDCFSAINEPAHGFSPGDIILHKFPEHSNVKSSSGPCIFMGYTDKPFETADRTAVSDPGDWHGSAACERIDCRIAMMHGNAFVTFFGNSTLYRLHPDHLTGGKH